MSGSKTYICTWSEAERLSLLRPHFGEVADDVRPLLVDFGEDVEDEGLHVKVKCLVVEEEFRE